jgi:hypothetical protein
MRGATQGAERGGGREKRKRERKEKGDAALFLKKSCVPFLCLKTERHLAASRRARYSSIIAELDRGPMVGFAPLRWLQFGRFEALGEGL